MDRQPLALLLTKTQILLRQLRGCLGSGQKLHSHNAFAEAHWLESTLVAVDGVAPAKSIGLYQELWGLHWLLPWQEAQVAKA